MTEVLDRILARVDELAAEAVPSDELGRLSDKTAALVKESGIIRMLQPKEFGGDEASPVDYEIVEDSWDVIGLRGTGSKDIIIRDMFIPSYRVFDSVPMEDGGLADQVGRGDSPLYRMPSR